MSQRHQARRAGQANLVAKQDWYLTQTIRRWLKRLKTHQLYPVKIT